ncbi:MAG: 4a-hydroxytetrahydrobiopterin dehydratase [Leptolyngbyaceae cyanobacterium SL_5_9]|nr:4a-hydroxytetrahydrobiopterin dehydratase [Leptolyngbyaceae cyanobacterium SL_5_9]NJO73804.1 4a-hydroxytetrahydrobiopterin dehydratase [Leptolyngbyaceae cyanobacterium RM1_406_9]
MTLVWKRAKRSLIVTASSLLLVVSSANAETLKGSMRLSEAEVSSRLEQVPGWIVQNQQLVCTYQFGDFVEAIAFVNRLVDPAEAASHHPDLLISYSRVTVNLTTHDAGGLTDLDFALAEAIAQLHAETPSSAPGCQPN